MKCDSCNREMSDKDFQKALDCGCNICGPWVVCESCHAQIKVSIEKRRKAAQQ